MPPSTDPEAEDASLADPVDAARHAIWLLFEDGQLDEDRATDALLAIDVGTRRMKRRRARAERSEGAPDP
jgi:hypothetical protein